MVMRSCNRCADRVQAMNGRYHCGSVKATPASVDVVQGDVRVWTLEAQRSAGWLMARIHGLCGREGRWFRDRGSHD